MSMKRFAKYLTIFGFLLVLGVGTAIALDGDLDGDGDVDRNDLLSLLAARNAPASGPEDPRDLDHDGRITVLDARKLCILCTRPRCAVEPQDPDSDGDGVPDSRDLCPGYDDSIDVDGDGIPDGCDEMIDSDGDGVPDDEDLCPGYDDGIDVDGDGIPDGCDEMIDSDGDGVPDDEDLCPGYDDGIDVDGDGIPDGCDPSVAQIVGPDGGTVEDPATGVTFAVGEGAFDEPTEVIITELPRPAEDELPPGSEPVSGLIDITLIPNPGTLGGEGATIVLPLDPASPFYWHPGTSVSLYKVRGTGSAREYIHVSSGGTVQAGHKALFSGVMSFSSYMVFGNIKVVGMDQVTCQVTPTNCGPVPDRFAVGKHLHNLATDAQWNIRSDGGSTSYATAFVPAGFYKIGGFSWPWDFNDWANWYRYYPNSCWWIRDVLIARGNNATYRDSCGQSRYAEIRVQWSSTDPRESPLGTVYLYPKEFIP